MKKYKNRSEELMKVFEEKKLHFGEGNKLSSMVSDILDKSYYNMPEKPPAEWRFERNMIKESMKWIRIDKLPTSDENTGNYRPKERMQGIFSAMQSMGNKVAFLLIRSNGYTQLYLGIGENTRSQNVLSKLQQVAQQNLAGASFSKVPDKIIETSILPGMEFCGVVTGQPSVRWDERENPLQNMDKLAGGLRINGVEKNYAVLILADPADDSDIKDVLERIHTLQSDLHEYAKWTETTNMTQGESQSAGRVMNANVGTSLILLALTAACVGSGLGVAAVPLLSTLISEGASAVGAGVGLGLSSGRSKSRGQSTSLTSGISSEHVNYSVKYCIGLLDKLVRRMEQGRNMGFWNTGIYVLAKDSDTVDIVSATLRSIYSGQDSYLEPLRIFNFGKSMEVMSYISNMQLLPLPVANDIRKLAMESGNGEEWHFLGKLYERMSTPVNTEELSIMMSLPQKDVAGLKIKDAAVEFSTNPPDTTHMRTVCLGGIQNMGAETGHNMQLDIDQINSHGLIVGMNGSGKSVTSRVVLKGMMKHKVPFLIIDPVKTDYVRWADTYNQKHQNDVDFKPIRIYAPGMKSIPGVKTAISELKMNPFQPYSYEGAPVRMNEHIGNLLYLLKRTLAMGEFLPMLLEEAVYNYVEGFFAPLNPDILNGFDFYPEKNQIYPTLSGLQKQVITLLEDRQYSAENTQNFTAAMQTRINSLIRGWKRDFFESPNSTPAEELFEENVVICLAGVTDNNDKAFLMSLILQGLNEYRKSKYFYDENYRQTVECGREKHRGSYLMHYTVVEEAHRILQNTKGVNSDADPQAAVAEMFSEMLSEIRETGEGLMIIDQYPSRLILDAIKNTNVKMIHKLQARDDIDSMSTCMSLKSKQSNLIASLERGNAVVNTGIDDTSSWVKVVR